MAEQLSWLPEEEGEAPPVKDLDLQYTPREVILPLHKEFNFTLDPCASAECPSAQIIGKFFTEKDNGLLQPWAGENVFLNCPYSNVYDWLAKVRYEMTSPKPAKLVVALLPAWPDRAWWQDYIEPFREGTNTALADPRRCRTRFYRGRIVHGCPGNPNGIGRTGGKFPSCLVIWGRKRA